MLQACGGNSSGTAAHSSPANNSEPGNSANKPINGKWKIDSKACAGKMVRIPSTDWIKFDSGGSFLAYVSTAENDDSHVCLHVDGFMINIMGAGQATTDGATNYSETEGIIRQSATRDLCRHKKDGEVQPDSYVDNSNAVSDDITKDIHLRHDASGTLTVTTSYPSFCSGAPAVFVLSPMQ